MLLRHHAGERVWSVLHEPTPEDEDARRTHRELARLMHERTAHTNRINSLLVLHNLRPHIVIGGRDWAGWWECHSEQVPPVLRVRLSSSARARDWRWSSSRSRRLRPRGTRNWRQASSRWVAQLAQLRAIGPKGAWVLVKEPCCESAPSGLHTRCRRRAGAPCHAAVAAAGAQRGGDASERAR